jgi:Transposase, Mutator family
MSSSWPAPTSTIWVDQHWRLTCRRGRTASRRARPPRRRRSAAGRRSAGCRRRRRLSSPCASHSRDRRLWTRRGRGRPTCSVAQRPARVVTAHRDGVDRGGCGRDRRARDRHGTCAPATVHKRQRRLQGVDAMVISLCTKGLTTGEIGGASGRGVRRAVSRETISKITDAVLEGPMPPRQSMVTSTLRLSAPGVPVTPIVTPVHFPLSGRFSGGLVDSPTVSLPSNG